MIISRKTNESLSKMAAPKGQQISKNVIKLFLVLLVYFTALILIYRSTSNSQFRGTLQIFHVSIPKYVSLPSHCRHIIYDTVTAC